MSRRPTLREQRRELSRLVREGRVERPKLGVYGSKRSTVERYLSVGRKAEKEGLTEPVRRRKVRGHEREIEGETNITPEHPPTRTEWVEATDAAPGHWHISRPTKSALEQTLHNIDTQSVRIWAHGTTTSDRYPGWASAVITRSEALRWLENNKWDPVAFANKFVKTAGGKWEKVEDLYPAPRPDPEGKWK